MEKSLPAQSAGEYLPRAGHGCGITNGADHAVGFCKWRGGRLARRSTPLHLVPTPGRHDGAPVGLDDGGGGGHERRQLLLHRLDVHQRLAPLLEVQALEAMAGTSGGKPDVAKKGE